MKKSSMRTSLWEHFAFLTSGTNSRRNNARRFAVRAEPLEVRVLLSAVTAQLAGGSLFVSGLDSQAKDISIHQDATDPTAFDIDGASGTIVNGVAAVGGISTQQFHLAALTANVYVNLAGATNLAVAGITGATLPGSAFFTLYGTGDNQLSVDNLAVGGSLSVTTSGGNDVLRLTGVTVGGSTSINSGSGHDHLIANGSTLHSTTVVTGAGEDVVDIGTSTTGNLSIYNYGTTAVMLQTDQVHGNLSLSGPLGEQTYLVSGVTVTSVTTITTSSQKDELGLYNSQLNGLALINLGAGDDVASVEGNTFSSVLVLSGGAGHDELTTDFSKQNTTPILPLLLGFEDKNLELVKDVHFSYSGDTGPAFWGQLTPAWIRAAVGISQSPININTKTAITEDLPNIKFNYSAQSNLTYFNNGHTIQVTVQPGNSIRVDGTDFQLKQFHIHTPSENELDGKQFDGELHLVHADADGNLAVVGIFL